MCPYPPCFNNYEPGNRVAGKLSLLLSDSLHYTLSPPSSFTPCEKPIFLNLPSTPYPDFLVLVMAVNCPVKLAFFNCKGFNTLEKQSQILYHLPFS